MSGPRAVSDLLAAWTRGLTNNEHESLNVLYQAIAEAIRRGQKVPPSIDRRCMALVVQKLEEAEHWALQALRIAVDREDVARDNLEAGLRSDQARQRDLPCECPLGEPPKPWCPHHGTFR